MGTTDGGDGCTGAHNSAMVMATVKEELPAEQEEEKETKAAAMESASVAGIASASTTAHDVGAEASSGGMMDCPSAVADEARSQQTLNDDEGNLVSARRSKSTAAAGDSLQESPGDDDDHIFNHGRDYRGFGDEDEHGSKRQRLQRHTPQQIHELESVFNRCPLPDQKHRQELSDALGLKEEQISFWFRNRRKQAKALQELHSDRNAQQANAEVRRMKAENVTVEEATVMPCSASPAHHEPAANMLYQQDMDESIQRKQAESGRLRDELVRAAPNTIGRAFPIHRSSAPQLAIPLQAVAPDLLSLELAVGRYPAPIPLLQLHGHNVGKDMEIPVQSRGKSKDISGINHAAAAAAAAAVVAAGGGGIGHQEIGQPVRRTEAESGGFAGRNSEGGSREDLDASQDEHENGSGKIMEETASGDDQESEEMWKKKRYQRHTAEQIHQLELFFKQCAHPDQRQRERLSAMLGLNMRQVKFWFQNRRNQMKNLQERYDNTQLRAEIDRLRAENLTIRETIKQQQLASCNESASMQQEMADEEIKRRTGSAQLREEETELVAAMPNGAATTAAVGGPPLVNVFHDSLSLELAVGRRPTLQESMVAGMMKGGEDQQQQQQQQQQSQSMLGVALSWPGGMSGPDKAALMDLADSALQEILHMVQAKEPLWIKMGATGDQALDTDAYMKRFPSKAVMQAPGLLTEASRHTGVVNINSLGLIDALMDANKWMLMFPSIISKALTIKVISPGTGVTLDGAVQLMYAELQVLSPLLQTREMYFLRFCKHVADKLWVVVDVSLDCLRDNPPPCLLKCRRRPSGCVIQEMHNGQSQVTWLEHVEVSHQGLSHVYLHFLSSGSAFGAKRWVCALQHYCEDISSLLSTNMATARDLGVINTLEGRRSALRLAKKMVSRYCSNVSAASDGSWIKLPQTHGNDLHFMVRDNAGDGIILCAATSTWLPFPHQRVFDFLRSERYRAQRNVLANGSAQEMSHIGKGQNPGSSVSLLRVNGPSQSNILILQESWTDESCSLLVYMPVDFATITRVLRGEDPSDFLLLPSGFAILRDSSLENHGTTSAVLNPDGSNPSTTRSRKTSSNAAALPPSNSLLTVSFQTVVNHVPPSGGKPLANPVSSILSSTMESMNTVSKIILNTLQHIRMELESPKP